MGVPPSKDIYLVGIVENRTKTEVSFCPPREATLARENLSTERITGLEEGNFRKRVQKVVGNFSEGTDTYGTNGWHGSREERITVDFNEPLCIICPRFIPGFRETRNKNSYL